MIHALVPEAVIRKSQTVPPDTLIGNTEMAACIGLVYKDAKISKVPEFRTPAELYDDFMEHLKDLDESLISETSLKMIDMVKQYQVLPMKNETMDDLKIILNITIN